MTFHGLPIPLANIYTVEGKFTGGASAVTVPRTGAGKTVLVISCIFTNVANGPATMDLVESTSGNILCQATSTDIYREAYWFQSSGEELQIQFDSTVTVGQGHYKLTIAEIY